ncbi:MAG: DEAD/DEAH box helicase family protein [Gracilimonas sp.]
MLKDIRLPSDLSYASDAENKPLSFYLQCLKKSKRFDLRLGYFSSNAIRVLSLGFAQFIFNGGVVRIITNHFLSEKDKYLLENSVKSEGEEYSFINSIVNNDVEKLEQVLARGEQHFFDCLRFLMKENRLLLKPVKVKPGRTSHYKEGIFSDGENQIYFNGSCNFTYNGLVENGESLDVKRSWGSEEEQLRIKNEIEKLDSIFSEEDAGHEYLSLDEIEGVIRRKGLDKDLEELVRDEEEIFKALDELDDSLGEVFDKEKQDFKKWIRDELKLPTFPHDNPYPYQVKAYEAWVENGYNGIFAMATGTGKTITSLNCLLEEYKKSSDNIYQALILVPTLTLVEQWENEAKQFNFNRIISVSSKTDYRNRLSTILATANRTPTSFLIICTYASFIREGFLRYINNLPEDTLFIADEAHNIGSSSVLNTIENVKVKKRIGLSATPKRVYDPEGTEAMETFFNDGEPYTYNYSMEQAITKGVLCKYDYFPHIVQLTSEELEEYIKLTKRIAKCFASKDSNSLESEILERLLLKRKRIIHKASNKLGITVEILKERYNEAGTLKYTFVYVPEGKNADISEVSSEDEEELKIINQYIMAIGSIDDSIFVNKFVSGMRNRDQILEQFRNGDIDVIASMKCLDEGVDIPRAEHAIFCSSTGNPRQFIQRRGRILRTHKDKTKATIHDLIVIPDFQERNSETFETEKRLVKNELERVMYFASLSKNPYHTEEVFSDVCRHYDLNIYSISVVSGKS